MRRHPRHWGWWLAGFILDADLIDVEPREGRRKRFRIWRRHQWKRVFG